jgi:hypothetical protein
MRRSLLRSAVKRVARLQEEKEERKRKKKKELSRPPGTVSEWEEDWGCLNWPGGWIPEWSSEARLGQRRRGEENASEPEDAWPGQTVESPSGARRPAWDRRGREKKRRAEAETASSQKRKTREGKAQWLCGEAEAGTAFREREIPEEKY